MTQNEIRLLIPRNKKGEVKSLELRHIDSLLCKYTYEQKDLDLFEADVRNYFK